MADAFDAMTSTRSYRPGRPVPAAVAELERCAGSQFDPRMVGALVRALDRHGWSTTTAITSDEEADSRTPRQRAAPSRAPAAGPTGRPGRPR